MTVSEITALPASFRRSDLVSAGFTGWRTWEQLRRSDFAEVPAAPAAYVVARASADSPTFLDASPGGWHKGKDPTVPVGTLVEKWVTGAEVVYIGKANVANRRLRQFARFGGGHRVGHWGGRYIWQLADSGALVVAWHAICWQESAREYEKRLLARFAETHGGMRPFANLVG